MTVEPSSRRLFVAGLLTVLLIAAGLRLYRLPQLPLGLHYDEAANGILAGEIARGVKTPIFIPSYTGKEVLFFYWTALWMKLLGATPLALRLSAALVGVATVAATAWVTSELFYDCEGASWIALFTAAFVATSFWHLILSRYGFRAITQPLLQALTVAALLRGLRLDKKGWLLVAGLFCGLTAYTYLAARAFPFPLAAALLTVLVVDHKHRRRRFVQFSIFIGVAALVLAPLARYWLTHPGSFSTRMQQVAAPSWREAWNGIRACLKMFFLKGDPDIRFNLPFRPLFDPLTTILFLLGIAVVFRRGVRPSGESCFFDSLRPASCVFLLAHLMVMLLPSALATDGSVPNNLRVVGLLPFVYIFPARGLLQVCKFASLQVCKLRGCLHTCHLLLATCHLLLATCHILLLAVLTPLTARAYFHKWAPSEPLYYAADGDLAQIAIYLNRTELDDTTPYVASVHYRHPTIAFLAEDYARIRWLTGGRTLVFPAEHDGLLFIPRSASDDLDWIQTMLSDDALFTGRVGPDFAPAFRAYRVDSTHAPLPPRAVTADFGHAAELLGYEILNQPQSGEGVEVAVWWRVLNKPAQDDYGPAARLTDPWGFPRGETRPFPYPSGQWTPGEVVVDHLSIPVVPGAPPGDYDVRLGFYSPGADARLPILNESGAYAGTYVELPVQLASAEKPPAVSALGVRRRLNARVGGLTLLGVNLDATSVRPGERLPLALFWRADEAPLPDYEIVLDLGSATLYEGAPVHGAYPASDWAAGEIIADRYRPRVPREMPPGEYPLRLRVVNKGESEMTGKSLNLGSVAVHATERAFEPPSISHQLTATLSARVELLGYDLSAEEVALGDTLTLTLYWRALTEMEESYTVFTHLLAPDGLMSGQKDSPPVGGRYPTDLWLSGEVVTDVYEIPVSADAAPGEHRLEVGMYDAETGARLPIEGSAGDAIILQTVNVVPQ